MSRGKPFRKFAFVPFGAKDQRVLLKLTIAVVIMTAVKPARKKTSPEILDMPAPLKSMDFMASTA